tara:strand:- start:6919 stop:7707 length:789 start_codon:yes stop_codon:yes gene_type:complete
MGRLVAQPLLWFVVISLCIFILDDLMPEARDEIFVSDAQKDRIALLWKTQTGEDASIQELDSLVDNWIQEEVLFREALRLGLDQDDSIVRRRLVQKLGFIAEAQMGSEPEISELESYYSQNIVNYTLPLRYSFRQLYFTDQVSAQAQLGQAKLGEDISSTGTTSMLNDAYAFRSELDIDATFGSGFSSQLIGLSVLEWQGPIKSSFGYHLVYVTSIHAEEAAPLNSVLDSVGSDYQQFQKMNARQRYVDALLDDYLIRYEGQ